ncbi:hypothetical protein LSUE1_G001280 [Lachnellula suecica]|uniref:Uncharacterized protein n=1 Tax=Lachnellula suecica TaxID=602035 RepID=A0A8T9CKY7_9HELO|nr:hypothetical protein LSUE1_G001280 [Lachnellula suecica]
MEQRIRQARREAQSIKDRIQRKKDDLADNTLTSLSKGRLVIKRLPGTEKDVKDYFAMMWPNNNMAGNIVSTLPLSELLPSRNFTSWGSTYSTRMDFKRKAVRVIINNKECFARPDTGSDEDVMTEAFAQEHNVQIQREDKHKGTFMLGAGTFIQSIGIALVPFHLLGEAHSDEHRWFHVLKKCPEPLILGMKFLEKIKLYTKNKHLLVDSPHASGSMPTLKWIGSPGASVNLRANGKTLVGCADTGSDLDLISLRCAKRLGLDIDTRQSARTRVMLADESVIETVGQTVNPSVQLSSFDTFEMAFHVLPGLASDVIFSEEFLEQMDAFHTCAQIKDSEDPYQQRLNTLINLGPVQAFLSRTWTPNVADTAQQKHDQVIEAEIYRRKKTNRTIGKIKDPDRASATREAEEVKKRSFDTGHQRCLHCVGETYTEGP